MEFNVMYFFQFPCYAISRKFTKQVCVAVTVYTCIRDVCGYRLVGFQANLTDMLRGFPQTLYKQRDSALK
jgi:hypothetical protein